MPNWCSNHLVLHHDDPQQITRAADAFRRGEFLQELVPNPVGEWDYDWSVSHWGTKWDVGGDNYNEPQISEDGRTLTLGFDSAWSPPTMAYDVIATQGFEISAMYYESGMAYAGQWTNDTGDDYYEFSGMSADRVQDLLPSDLDEMFGISECIREYEQEEPLTDWYMTGAKEKGLLNG